VAECEDRPRQSASRLHLSIAVPEATKVSAPLALTSGASFMRRLVQSEEAAQAEAFAQLEAFLLREQIAGSPFDVTVAAAQPFAPNCAAAGRGRRFDYREPAALYG
jgi:hypothetical protein